MSIGSGYEVIGLAQDSGNSIANAPEFTTALC